MNQQEEESMMLVSDEGEKVNGKQQQSMMMLEGDEEEKKVNGKHATEVKGTITIKRAGKTVSIGIRIVGDIIYTEEEGVLVRPDVYSAKYSPFVVRYLLERGITSKVAIFYMIETLMSKTYADIKLEEMIAKWNEYRKRVRQIARRAREMRALRVEKAMYFAINVLYLSIFGDKKVEGCPYRDPGSNFIISLVRTHSCYCLCSASFVVAMAEMYDYGDEIVYNVSPGHVGLSVLDKSKGTTGADVSTEVDFGDNIGEFAIPQSSGDMKIFPVYANLDGGIEDMDVLQISSMMPEVSLRRTFVYRKSESFLIVYLQQLPVHKPRYMEGGDLATLRLLFLNMGTRRSKQLQKYKNSITVLSQLYGFGDALQVLFMRARAEAVKAQKADDKESIYVEYDEPSRDAIAKLIKKLRALYPASSSESVRDVVGSTVWSTRSRSNNSSQDMEE